MLTLFRHRLASCLTIATMLALPAAMLANEASFFRAVNLNGPALTIDGRPWDGAEAVDFAATGNSFATPHLAAICARIRSAHPGLTPFQVKQLLYLTATNVAVAAP